VVLNDSAADGWNLRTATHNKTEPAHLKQNFDSFSIVSSECEVLWWLSFTKMYLRK